jgi:uncharacterized protein (TIRG00374 family)
MIVFAYLLYTIDLSQTYRLLRNVSEFYLLSVVLLFLVLIGIKAWRWQSIFRTQKIHSSYIGAFLAYLSSFVIGIVTPGRAGELIKVNYLINLGHSFGKSLFSVLLDRLLDIAFVLLVGCFGMLLFFSAFKSHIIFVGCAALFALIIVILLGRKKSIRRVTFALCVCNKFARFIPDKVKEKITLVFSEMSKGVRHVNFASWSMASVYTVSSWVVYYLQVYLLALSLKIGISFVQIVMFISAIGIMNLLPISISGIGVRDASLMFFFSQIGRSHEQAIAFSCLILFLTFISAMISLAAWWVKPLKLSHIKANGGK